MLRLLNLELQKLLLNKTSKVLIFISFILPFFVILLSSLKINVFGFFTLELGEKSINSIRLNICICVLLLLQIASYSTKLQITLNEASCHN